MTIPSPVKAAAAAVATVAVLATGALAASSAFDDVAADHPAAAEIAAAHQIGVFQGYRDGTFRPDGKLTQAQAENVIWRILFWQGTDDDGNFEITRADAAVLAMAGLCGLDRDRIPGCAEVAAAAEQAAYDRGYDDGMDAGGGGGDGRDEGLGSATADVFAVTVKRLVPRPEGGVRIDYTVRNPNPTDYARARFGWEWVSPDGWQVSDSSFQCPGEQADGDEVPPNGEIAFTACLPPRADDLRFNAELGRVDWSAPGGMLLITPSFSSGEKAAEAVILLPGRRGANPPPPRWWRIGLCPPQPDIEWHSQRPTQDGRCVFSYDDGGVFSKGHPPKAEAIKRCLSSHGGYTGRVLSTVEQGDQDHGVLTCMWPYGPPLPWPAPPASESRAMPASSHYS